LYYKTGSKLYIPKNTFVQQNGDIVNTSVKLQYREFHSSVDIFLSGIPMQYDGAGTQYHFESAGMCELYGFDDKNPLQIATGKACKIEMASQKASTKFNLYQLDTSSGVWTNLGKDIVKNIATEKQVPQNSQKKNKKITQELAKIAKPIKPTKANPDRPWLQIDVDDTEYPELIAYKNVVFEVLETTPYDRENQKINWDKISLQKGKKKGTYKILFEKGERKGEYDVQPALQGEDYQAALKEYEKKFATYEATKKQAEIAKETARKESQIREQQVQDEMTQAIAAEKLRQENDVKFIQEQEKQQIIAMKNLSEAQNLVYRTIVANNFGIYNCDLPKKLPLEKMIGANFISKENQILYIPCMTLAEKTPNMTYMYSVDKFNEFQFNPTKENIVFGITFEGYLAYFTSADFEKIPKNVEKYNFQMRIHKEKLKSQEELEKLLGI
jgi:hypothetical protein